MDGKAFLGDSIIGVYLVTEETALLPVGCVLQHTVCLQSQIPCFQKNFIKQVGFFRAFKK